MLQILVYTIKVGRTNIFVYQKAWILAFNTIVLKLWTNLCELLTTPQIQITISKKTVKNKIFYIQKKSDLDLVLRI